MNRTLSEKKVLKKLGIDDFRHLSKDKVMVMASMLDRMDPEVAQKVLEQFPDFAGTMREIFKEYKISLDKGFDTNDKSVDSYYATCDSIISACQKELEKESLSFDERQRIIDRMIDVANMKGAKDTENKKFIVALGMLSVSALSVTATVLLTALGGNAKVSRD